MDTLNDPNATPEQLQQAAATLSGLADAFDGSGFERSWDHDNDEATPNEPITAAEQLRKWAGYAGDRAGSIYTGDDITAENPLELGSYKHEERGGPAVTKENAHDAWEAISPHIDKALEVYRNLNSGTRDMGNAAGDLIRASYDFRGKGVMLDHDDNPDTPPVDAGEWLYNLGSALGKRQEGIMGDYAEEKGYTVEGHIERHGSLFGLPSVSPEGDQSVPVNATATSSTPKGTEFENQLANDFTTPELQGYLDNNPNLSPEARVVIENALGIRTANDAKVPSGDQSVEQQQTEPHVPAAGSSSDVASLFARSDSGFTSTGELRLEQGTTNSWYDLNEMEDDSGINLVGPSYKQTDENTFVADGEVSMGNGTGRVQTTYTRHPDGTITSQSRVINRYRDDFTSGGGGGGGADTPLTLVSRSSNGYTIITTAEGKTVYDSDGNYVASLDSEGGEVETPSSAPPSLAVAIDSIEQKDRAGSTTVEVTGVTAADNLTLDDLRPVPVPVAGPNVAEIATYALPESGYGGSKGYNLTAEELKELNLPPDATPAEIKTAVDAYNAENPPESPPVGSVITEAQAIALGNPDLTGRTVTKVDPDGTIWHRAEPPPVGSVITEAQAIALGNPDLAGRTVTKVDPDGTIWTGSAPDSVEPPSVGSVITEAQAITWGNPDLAGRTVTKVDPDGTVWSINKDEEQAVADFKSDVAPQYLGPDDYIRLAEKWETNPDNALVQIPVYGETDDGYGLLGYQTPSEYFRQQATDPTVIANEAIFEEQRRTLPGETGVIGAQVNIDPVTGTLQVSPGVMPAVRAHQDEQERQERFLPGETGVIGTQVQVDPVTGTLQVSPGVAPLVQAHQDEQERQERTLPGETGQIGTQVQVDPVTGTLQVSPGVMPAVQAHQDEQESQQRFLPGETGTIGNQVNIDPVTGTLQVSPGVMPAVAAAQAAMPQEGDLGLIGGDLNIPLDLDGVERLKSNMATIRVEAVGAGVASDPANLEAQQTRLDRINNGEFFTIDDVKAADPGISDEDAKERVLYEAVLDIFAANLIDDIGSIELYNALRRRGFNPVDAGKYSKKAHDDGLTTISDLVAVGGATAGGYVGAFVATRLVPVFTSVINPRLTTGILRGGVEEVGEESGELIADVIHAAVTGGNPVAILLDPKTYAYAGGSILFSSVAEADSPGVRPQADAVPNGAVGTGAVHSLDGPSGPHGRRRGQPPAGPARRLKARTGQVSE